MVAMSPSPMGITSLYGIIKPFKLQTKANLPSIYRKGLGDRQEEGKNKQTKDFPALLSNPQSYLLLPEGSQPSLCSFDPSSQSPTPSS